MDNPRIYYGENTLESIIVNTNTEELDYQTEQGDLIRTRYAGDGGVKLSSLLRKLAYAWEFGDINILISGEITPRKPAPVPADGPGAREQGRAVPTARPGSVHSRG